ncbi:MAG: hypothetical protein IKS07_06390 [Lachnospiraceae bacterium]|nr:hypothetical protein [Lachnospiraceae bacterium]
MFGKNAWNLIATVLDIVARGTILVLIVYFIYTNALKCYDYGYRVFTEDPISSGNGREVTVTVPAGFSGRDLGELFEERGLSRDWILLMLQYYASEYREDIVPGTYTLSTAMTAEEMFEAMAEAAKAEALPAEEEEEPEKPLESGEDEAVPELLETPDDTEGTEGQTDGASDQ